jgi:hypothetical protein
MGLSKKFMGIYLKVQQLSTSQSLLIQLIEVTARALACLATEHIIPSKSSIHHA